MGRLKQKDSEDGANTQNKIAGGTYYVRLGNLFPYRELSDYGFFSRVRK